MVDPIVTPSTAISEQFWLNAAHGAVRRECGWHVAPVLEETLTLDGSGGPALLLPSMRVVELFEVTNAGALVDVDLIDTSQAGILELQRGTWTRRRGRVVITLRHGYRLDEVPEVAALIATLTRRAASAPGIVASQSVNGASVSYLTAGGAPLSISLLQIEKDLLAPYRIEGRA